MFVYVISEAIDGPCKIGYGHNPSARLVNCQIGNPRRLTLSYQVASSNPKRVEFVAHGLLRAEHIGGEWFSVSVAQAMTAIAEAAVRVGDTPERVAAAMAKHHETIEQSAALHPRWEQPAPQLPAVLAADKRGAR